MFHRKDGECGEGVSMKWSENATLLENIRVHKLEYNELIAAKSTQKNL